MKPKINFITLAVDDLEKAVAFYRDKLGWPTDGIIGQDFHDEVTGADGTIAFFQLEKDLKFGLYERSNLALDAGVLQGPVSSTECSLGIMVGSRQEVDRLLARVKAAGGKLTAPPHLRPFGVYSGYFQDPDGHLWEVICNVNN